MNALKKIIRGVIPSYELRRDMRDIRDRHYYVQNYVCWGDFDYVEAIAEPIIQHAKSHPHWDALRHQLFEYIHSLPTENSAKIQCDKVNEKGSKHYEVMMSILNIVEYFHQAESYNPYFYPFCDCTEAQQKICKYCDCSVIDLSTQVNQNHSYVDEWHEMYDWYCTGIEFEFHLIKVSRILMSCFLQQFSIPTPSDEIFSAWAKILVNNRYGANLEQSSPPLKKDTFTQRIRIVIPSHYLSEQYNLACSYQRWKDRDYVYKIVGAIMKHVKSHPHWDDLHFQLFTYISPFFTHDSANIHYKQFKELSDNGPKHYEVMLSIITTVQYYHQQPEAYSSLCHYLVIKRRPPPPKFDPPPAKSTKQKIIDDHYDEWQEIYNMYYAVIKCEDDLETVSRSLMSCFLHQFSIPTPSDELFIQWAKMLVSNRYGVNLE